MPNGGPQRRARAGGPRSGSTPRRALAAFSSFPVRVTLPTPTTRSKAGGEVLAANTIRDRYNVSKGDEATLRTGDGYKDFKVGGGRR